MNIAFSTVVPQFAFCNPHFTLQSFASLDPAELDWRPGPDHYSLGQLFLHIAQAEDFHVRSQLEGHWDVELIRFPNPLPGKAEIVRYFQDVKERTLEALEKVTEDPVLVGELPDP